MSNTQEIQALYFKKHDQVRSLFAPDSSQEEIYAKIIELGRNLPPFPEAAKTESALVRGCQSQMYLYTEMKGGLLYFKVYSEALISAGLGALLVTAYSELPPEAILICPPLFLEELNLHKALSPGRSNGLASLLMRMKQEAMKYLSLSAIKI